MERIGDLVAKSQEPMSPERLEYVALSYKKSLGYIALHFQELSKELLYFTWDLDTLSSRERVAQAYLRARECLDDYCLLTLVRARAQGRSVTPASVAKLEKLYEHWSLLLEGFLALALTGGHRRFVLELQTEEKQNPAIPPHSRPWDFPAIVRAFLSYRSSLMLLSEKLFIHDDTFSLAFMEEVVRRLSEALSGEVSLPDWFEELLTNIRSDEERVLATSMTRRDYALKVKLLREQGRRGFQLSGSFQGIDHFFEQHQKLVQIFYFDLLVPIEIEQLESCRSSYDEGYSSEQKQAALALLAELEEALVKGRAVEHHFRERIEVLLAALWSVNQVAHDAATLLFAKASHWHEPLPGYRRVARIIELGYTSWASHQREAVLQEVEQLLLDIEVRMLLQEPLPA